jgi:hypothetical protein
MEIILVVASGLAEGISPLPGAPWFLSFGAVLRFDFTLSLHRVNADDFRIRHPRLCLTALSLRALLPFTLGAVRKAFAASPPRRLKPAALAGPAPARVDTGVILTQRLGIDSRLFAPWGVRLRLERELDVTEPGLRDLFSTRSPTTPTSRDSGDTRA